VAEQLPVEEHGAEFLRIVGHLPPAAGPLAPYLAGEIPQLRLLGEPVHKVAPRHRLRRSGQLAFNPPNILRVFPGVGPIKSESFLKLRPLFALRRPPFLHRVI
jgi:hypothetical protein